MCTTFDIFPSTTYIPTFEELLELTNLNLKEQLSSIDIFDDVKIKAQLRKKDENIILNSILTNGLRWDDNYYAWFFFEGIPGGTDAYFWDNNDLYKEFLAEELQINKNMQSYQDRINKSIKVGYRWSFRRSAGQPGIIALSYGLLAASLCKLTEGLIFSDDGAWDYNLFPTTADDFFMWYFKPELANKQDDKIWAEECIISIRNDLNMLKSNSFSMIF